MTYSKEVKKALDESIALWKLKLDIVERNIGEKIARTSTRHFTIMSKIPEVLNMGKCPLCIATKSCNACPIITQIASSDSISQGFTNCDQTPYFEIIETLIHYDSIQKSIEKKLIALVKKEIDFLERVKIEIK